MDKEEILKRIEKEFPEINLEDGMEFSAGNAETYLKLLQVVHSTGMDQSKIDACISVSPDGTQYVEPRNMAAFKIMIHGIKSSMKSIGANELSERARLLEVAGKSLDFEKIKEKTPSFFEDYGRFLRRLRDVLSEYEKKDTEVGTLSREEVIVLIKKISEFISNYDLDEAETDLDKLLSGISATVVSEEAVSYVSAARNSMTSYDYSSLSDNLQKALAILEVK